MKYFIRIILLKEFIKIALIKIYHKNLAKGKLKYFFDADIQIIDEFLRKMLSQNASSKMKTIVETIQKDQDMIIRGIIEIEEYLLKLKKIVI